MGKTRILRAIRTVQRIGLGGSVAYAEQGFRFDVRFEHEGQDYSWQLDRGVRGPMPGEDDAGAAPSMDRSIVVLGERLIRGQEEPLVERDAERFLFKQQALPMLDRSASAVKLLDEPSIERLRQAFARGFLGELDAQGIVHSVLRAATQVARDHLSLESLRRSAGIHPVLKAFVLQEKVPEQFEHLKQLFIDIFPTVEDLRVAHEELAQSSSGLPADRLSFTLKERGVPTWIEARDISSGMARTLTHLVDLMLAPAGTVVLIDEFENSLGVNCMGPLTDFVLSRANDLQFIITSHHPYIINNIPKAYWKLVRRKGSTVRVEPASEIPALQGTSAQDDFIRLINSPEFEEGME
ncbi:ATP-binding protein [Archangium violaceum]|uniref:AAA family ATPase n=1 Tax=Archangium violaceum TaxID=83451 RepID=UPI0019528865|nr:AAA family ATPase [Archangium violaceum]QRN97539.1 ATP-binding protein [Archangium violaceum]